MGALAVRQSQYFCISIKISKIIFFIKLKLCLRPLTLLTGTRRVFPFKFVNNLFV